MGCFLRYFMTNPVPLRSLSGCVRVVGLLIAEDTPDGLPGDEHGDWQHQQHPKHAENVVSSFAAPPLDICKTVLLGSYACTYVILTEYSGFLDFPVLSWWILLVRDQMFSGSSECWCPLWCWELKVLTRDRSLKYWLWMALLFILTADSSQNPITIN